VNGRVVTTGAGRSSGSASASRALLGSSRTAALVLLALPASPARAHEFRPGVLRVDLEPAALELRLELPPEVRAAPRVELPPGCAQLRPPPALRAACDPAALRGELRVHDLPAELALVAHVRAPGLAPRTAVLRADAPALPLAADAPGAARYLGLGVAHILGGLDHLLFVVGLALGVRGLAPLLATLTAFTLAHSLTLALAALDLLRLPGPPVEACIAASLVLLARALVRGDLSERTPWGFALGCGLLHGLGFAGALADVGLPAGAAVGALAAFNLGVELGQAAVAALVLALAAALARLRPRLPLRPCLAYAIGGLACAWTAERLLALGAPA
jgi:hydrogenase/urease accessory protein HupE